MSSGYIYILEQTIVELDAHLPVTETTFFILLSLSSGPLHGYAIMKDVRSLSRERIILSTGTLYGALKRLLDQGWIVRADESEPASDQRERKAYVLTSLGKRVLEAEVSRLGNLVALARQRTAREQA